MKLRSFICFVLCFVGTCYGKKLILSYTPTTLQQRGVARRPSMAILDTSRREKYHYKTLIDIAESNRFDVTYHPISTVIDAPNIPIKTYDCCLFVLCLEFLKTMYSSPVSKKMLHLIEQSLQNPHKITILMFPSSSINHQDPVGVLQPLFGKIDPGRMHVYKALTNRFLKMPIENRPLLYHTSLNVPMKNRPGFQVSQVIHADTTSISMLPIKQQCAKEIKSLFPLGVYCFNKSHNNHVVVTSSSLLFSGIAENFKICPLKFDTRKALHNAIDEMFWEIYSITQQPPSIQGIQTKHIIESTKNSLPLSLLAHGARVPRTHNKKIAWMEIALFDSHQKKREQKRLINFIKAAQFDYLWITFNPNMYYSSKGRYKHKKNAFLKTVSNFTKQLAKSTKKPPGIFIGFEIANNLYKPHLPAQQARDVYGNHYFDIPRPLDNTFWREEVERPLQSFLQQWNHISHGIKLSGIMLDLEMYCRQTTGSFLPTMGFEPETIAEYLKPPLKRSIPAERFSQYLMDNNLSKDYFDYLERRATAIGQHIKRCMRTYMPKGKIGCYAPSISIDWFYKGLYRGLSSPQKPIYLLTFNVESHAHKRWLVKHNIYAQHLGAVMFSKFSSPNDTDVITHMCKHNEGGVWFNRLNWTANAFDKNHWSFLEQTPMNFDDRMKLMQFLGKQTFHK